MAQSDRAPRLACNLNAIAPAARPRYHDLSQRLREAVRDQRELADGYLFLLDGGTISLTESAEWIGFERLCCPFLTFRLEIISGREDWSLALTGPPGVKAILEAEFPKTGKPDATP